MTENSLDQTNRFIDYAREVLAIEAGALAEISAQLDSSFGKACNLLLNCRGRIVVSGIGKSGHIGRKISSTLSSTGSPSFFVHPAEASHGDLGMIAKEDVVIAISYSGESAELNLITPALKRQNVLIVAITGNKNSTLAKLADVTLHCPISKEACPLGLAPTSSTTATLALGDALAIALLRAKGFTEHDFAKSHPGGSLGRSLLTRVSDIMRSGDEFPQVTSQTGIQDAIIEITSKKMGITAVMENNGLVGIITDGDLRRAFQKSRSLDNLVAKEIMTASPKTITDQALAAEAVQLMEKYNINQLIVLDREKHPTGVVGMHDLLRAKIL